MSAKLCRLMSSLELLINSNRVQHLTNFVQRCRIHTTAPVVTKHKPIHDPTKYTLKPLKMPKTGGRGPDGTKVYKRIGGGNKRNYRMVDHTRNAEKDGAAIVERVMAIKYDPNRSASIAVVAEGEKKRYITATENMKVGDFIKTTNSIPTIAVVSVEGNSHPLGALSPGTIVHNVEEYVGRGGIYARAAGTGAQMTKRVENKCFVKLPSGHTVVLPQECMATVGKVSNPKHNLKKMKSAGEARWRGIKPKSVPWKKKTGIYGRKIKTPKTIQKGDSPPTPRIPSKPFTF